MIEFNDSFTQVAVAQAMSVHSDLHRLIAYQLTFPKWAHDYDETGKRTGPDKIKPLPTMHKTTLFVSPLDMVENLPREINFAWWGVSATTSAIRWGVATHHCGCLLQPRHQRQPKLEQPHMSIFEHMTWGLGTPNLPKLGLEPFCNVVMLISWATVPVCTASQMRRGGPSATRCCRTSYVS